LNKGGDEQFFTDGIYCDDGKALVFISNPLMEALSDCGEMFLDGTFRTVPPLFYQLVTIHVTAFAYVCFQFSSKYIAISIRKL
jgi:hypothetical protein